MCDEHDTRGNATSPRLLVAAPRYASKEGWAGRLAAPYSPECVEGGFSEVRLMRVLRSSPLAKQDYMLRTAETRDVGRGGDRDEESGCCGVSVAGRRDGVP